MTRTTDTILVMLVVVVVGVSAYLIGASSGEDVDAAREAGRKEGLTLGAKRGYAQGYAAGRKPAGSARSRTPSSRKGATGPVQECPSTGVKPNITALSVRGMDCAAATKLISGAGQATKTFSAKGFACSRLSGGGAGGTWRCVSGQKAFRFQFGA